MKVWRISSSHNANTKAIKKVQGRKTEAVLDISLPSFIFVKVQMLNLLDLLWKSWIYKSRWSFLDKSRELKVWNNNHYKSSYPVHFGNGFLITSSKIMKQGLGERDTIFVYKYLLGVYSLLTLYVCIVRLAL